MANTEAITSRYKLGLSDEPIELYRGPVEMNDAPPVEGIVHLNRMPQPHISIRLRGQISISELKDPESWYPTISLPALGVSVRAQLLTFSGVPADFDISLACLGNIGIGSPEGFSRVIFHVVNLRSFHAGELIKHVHSGGFATGYRMTLDDGEWRFSIDSSPGQKKAVDSLTERRGHAITHIGQLERCDGANFNLGEVEENFHLLDPFLSFINGDQCSLVLPVAYDAGGAEVWRGWNPGYDARWLAKPSWTDRLPTHVVSPAFPGFVRRWRDPDWQEPIRLAIEWYLQAKRGTEEGALLLGQAALELLCTVQFVERGTEKQEEFERLAASERIRRLLAAHDVRHGIPKPFEDLAALGFDDGPHAITAIRNGIVHPKKAKREKVLRAAPRARRQAANLGRYYIECVILSIFEYKNINFIPANTLFSNA